jgi:cytochrome c biogenesis protein ResB
VIAPNGNYTVVLDSFLVETNTEGAISDYLSHVTVEQDGEVVSRSIVQVNHPLRYEGWSWYQTTYRLVTERLRRITVDIHDSSDVHMGPLVLTGAESSAIPGRDDVRVTMERFYPHFQIKDGKPVNLSSELVNPAILLHIHRQGEPSSKKWLFLDHPDFTHGEEMEFLFNLTSIEPLFATGLEVKSFPGALGVWIGFALMTLGLGLSFGMNHERIWVFGTRRPGGGWLLDVGARSMHGEASLKGRFDSMTRALGGALETEATP